jgi:hypothetical protein
MPKRVAKKMRKVNDSLLTTLRSSIAKLTSSIAERERSFARRRGTYDSLFEQKNQKLIDEVSLSSLSYCSDADL